MILFKLQAATNQGLVPTQKVNVLKSGEQTNIPQILFLVELTSEVVFRETCGFCLAFIFAASEAISCSVLLPFSKTKEH